MVYWERSLVVAWLVPRETAAVSAQVLCTPYNHPFIKRKPIFLHSTCPPGLVVRHNRHTCISLSKVNGFSVLHLAFDTIYIYSYTRINELILATTDFLFGTWPCNTNYMSFQQLTRGPPPPPPALPCPPPLTYLDDWLQVHDSTNHPKCSL